MCESKQHIGPHRDRNAFTIQPASHAKQPVQKPNVQILANPTFCFRLQLGVSHVYR